jgi:predicted Zn-dependent protease with MMP-like domain
MKWNRNLSVLAGILVLAMVACSKKDVKETVPQAPAASVLEQIKKLGFSTQNVQQVEGGYLVEGDIVLTAENLSSPPTSPNLVIASEEQYQTFNLVNATHYGTIGIELDNSSPQHQDVLSAALDEAISRYNAENLSIQFFRETGNRPDITMYTFYQVGNLLGSSGFPSKSGRPYRQVQLNAYNFSTSTDATNVNFIATIMAHELGHCIGFRHTDYMDRGYSCNIGGNEGQETTGVGAVWIPGTPTGPDPDSWMLACISAGTNRPFNSNDKIALAYLY